MGREQGAWLESAGGAGRMSRLYIGHLSRSTRERDVEKFFKGYGRIQEIVLKDGYGFVVSGRYHAVHC